MNTFEKIIKTTVDYFFEVRSFVGQYLEPALPTLYVFAAIFSGIMLWLAIYCIAKSSWLNTKIEKGMDFFSVGDVGRRRQLKAWNHVVRRMQTNDMTNWKLAILEADNVLDEIVKASGYRAPSADERFKQLTPETVSNLAELQEAHRARNRVAQEPDFLINKDEALQVLRVYKKSFREFGLLD